MNYKAENHNEGLVPTFRSILEKNMTEPFTDKIDSNLKNYDKDIEKICNLFYQGFIDSINSLIRVKSNVKFLTNEVFLVEDSMIKTSTKFITSAEKISKIRLIESNILRAIEWLQKCLPVFECCSKFSYYISKKQYYESLKILEALEKDYLPTVTTYKFSFQMLSNIPKLKDSIKAYSEAEFREFLENIRKFSSKIGDVSMRYTKQMQKKNVDNIISDYSQSKIASTINESDISAYDLIDFSPIFKTYCICSELGCKDYFEKDYRQQRKDQIKLILQSPRSMHNDLDVYKIYIFGVIGFFVVEDHVRNTADEIASKLYLEDLWSTSLSTFTSNLNMNIYYCTDPNILLKLKTVTLLAIHNLKSCGYGANHLWELLYITRDHYNDVLLQRWVFIFRNILEKEDFLPIEVNSAEKLDALVEVVPFNLEITEQIQFPKTFPFSWMVPKIYNEAKEFNYAIMKFCEDLPLMPNEVAIIVRKAANLLFTNSFNSCITSLFRNPGLTLPQIIQIILDTKYLDIAAPYLNDFISDMTCAKENVNKVSTQVYQTSFEAENEVGIRICSKIDEFFDISDYNWLLMEPNGSASAYMTDMISYLRSTFQSFAHILPEIAQITCIRACKHISENIRNLLLDDDVKLITSAALQQINLDLMQCEFFAASDPVFGLEEGCLTKQFQQVRQLLDLLIMEEWSSYLHDYGKEENRYNMVEPNSVLIILDKMKEADKKALFSVLKKSERDKKKLRDAVQKQLKNLVDRL